MLLADELGVDVPKTLCFPNVSKINNTVIENMTYPCYLKAAISVAGVGIYRCENPTELKTNILKFRPHVPVQLQEEIQTDTFLNLQYQVIDDRIIRLAASEQILDGFTHQGNRVPAQHAPWEQIESMAIWLKDHGMKGIFAFDLAVVETDKGKRFPAIECNPRFNGASYPTLIAQKLGITEWSALTFSTKHRGLDDVDLSDIEYDPNTGEGVILINWGTVLTGKLVILLAGSASIQNDLKIDLEERLC